MRLDFTKHKKGEYGYLNYQHFLSTLKTVIIFIIALSIFAAGYIYYGNKENIVTVLSVLTLLPACHMMTLCIMFWRFNTGDSELYTLINEIGADEVFIFYDSVITIEKGGSYPVAVFACFGKNLIAYSDYKKLNITVVEKHIRTMLKNNKVEGVSFKLHTDKDAFLRRLDEISKKYSDSNGEYIKQDEEAIALIKALSL